MLKSNRRIKSRFFSRGFTTVELLAVVTILSVVLAIAIPSAIAFINYGKQQNRMNIARTVYLAAQGELTGRKLEKNLKSTLTGLYYEKTGGIYAALPTLNTERNNVKSQLGDDFPAADAPNKDFVHYISKPAGYAPMGDDSELDAFYSLLDGIIIDKDILNGAILMEYNIETGVIMSIFYGDELDYGKYFQYGGGDNADVSGGRGMDKYAQTAKERRQGYYGVGATGAIEPVAIADIVNIYDGIDQPLVIGGEEKRNVLYAKLLLAKNFDPEGHETAMPPYTLELAGASVKCELDFTYEMLSDFNFSLSDSGLVYLDDENPTVEQNSVNIGKYYKQYIWIIDYIDGDILAGQPYGIGASVEPADVRVKAVRDGGAAATSLTVANTHFYGTMPGGRYKIKSARHLNNIRYAPDGKFRQVDHIDMGQAGNAITNFAPIEGFSGDYYAMKDSSSQYRISNLVVDTAGAGGAFANTGLFADISGSVTGLSLFEATVQARGGNVGAVAGTLSGTLSQSNSYANVSAGASANAGGLVGEITAGGRLEQSFNAGFYDARAFTETERGFGSVRVLSGRGGGLAGANSGTIQNSFNNARVNVDNVEYNESTGLSHSPQYTQISDAAILGGIAGGNAGSISNCYATNYVPLNAESGGIAGENTGTVKNSYFLSNGSCGTGAVSKEALFAVPDGLGVAYSKGAAYDSGNNLYTRYPYPVLRSNRPFSEGLLWGWEDISVFETGGAVELMYYEIYNDNSFGFSKGTDNPLAGAGSGKLVSGDGYMLDFAFVQKLEIIIDGNPYVLNGQSELNPDWAWADNSHARKLANIPVAYTSMEDGEAVTRYRLFLENSVMEGYAKGGSLISFEVIILDDTENPVSFYLNPLFANTVGSAPNSALEVRSPRHLDNVDKAPGSSFGQGMNIDFSIYRKELIRISSPDALIALSNSSALAFSGESVVTGVFTGDYDGGNHFVQNAAAQFGLFDTAGAGAIISNLMLRDSAITGHWTGDTGIGGIVRENNGTISGCTVLSDTVSEDSSAVVGDYHVYVGGIAGINNGVINDCRLVSSHIEGAIHVGGIAGINNAGALIQGCEVTFSAVRGTWGGGNTDIGIIAGTNNGTISGCAVSSSEVEGQNHIGGIAGVNSAVITGCTVESSHIYGNNGGSNNIGGIAGECVSGGTISASGVLFSTVRSDGVSAGGIAGVNSGDISDVFFLSVNDLSGIPVTTAHWGRGGGIAGINNGSVARAFYFAPAPKTEGTAAEIYPIVGSGAPATSSFYLQGSRYSLEQGREGTWNPAPYNREEAGQSITVSGGGKGLLTKFADVEWLSFNYKAALDNWYQPTGGYPYLMPKGIDAPELWPATDAPARPGQLDKTGDEWAVTRSTSDRAQTLGFVNGNFNAPFTAYEKGVTAPTGGSGGGWTDNTWDLVDMDSVNGWYTRPVSSNYNYFDINNFSGGEALVNSNGYYYYGPVKWRLIEFQEPNGKFDFMPTNHKGQYNARTGANVAYSEYRYAELNAEMAGTLYQVCTTTPGAQFYYSFYHASNNYPASDSMGFYLSPLSDDDITAVTNASEAAERDSKLVMIRPCSSPRSQPSPSYTNSTSLPDLNRTLNPNAWNTVVYDPRSGDFAGFDLSYHRGKEYSQPGGTVTVQNIPTTGTVYLYDVWVGDTSTAATNGGTRGGYGITFWSAAELTTGSGSGSSIPIGGVTQSQYAQNTWAWLADAKTNVIGYWGVDYGWKHYYGLYEVPEGQTRTEFAYQSKKTTGIDTGNYLDGVSFKSPAFLSIDQNIKRNGEDVSFVKLNEEMTVELHVTSWGEISADNIVVSDDFTPYNEYIEYIGDVTVTKNGSPVTGCQIKEPTDGDYTLNVALPPETTLSAGESLTVTFKIRTLNEVKSAPGVNTLLFYFRNQAEVAYKEDARANRNGFDGYINNVKRNASEILKVYIDPVKLSKTVTPSIDGPFTVTLTVEDTLGEGSSIETSGLITDNIPKDFTVLSRPEGSSLLDNGDGSSRLVIQNVNLGYEKRLEFTYTLQYGGAGYGVAYTSVSADYKYLYIDEKTAPLSVMLNFPQTPAGIRVKTQDDDFILDGTGTHLLNIIANDNFKASGAMADSNYDVTPEVVLLSGSGGGAAGTNGDGNYQIDNELYRAVMIRGSNRLQFTPKAGAGGKIELYYQIRLIASKAGAASFNLSSRITKVTVYFPVDSLVYYEGYADGTYGFFAPDLPDVWPGLKDSIEISETGYGVLSAISGGTARLEGGAASSAIVDLNGAYLYKLDTSPTDSLSLQTVLFGGAALGKIHPNFAKAVYAADAESAGDTFYIRTRAQRDNISLIPGMDGMNIILERGIERADIAPDHEGSGVGGTAPGGDESEADDSGAGDDSGGGMPGEPDETPAPSPEPEDGASAILGRIFVAACLIPIYSLKRRH